MTTKLMNNLELTHIAGGVGRWYDIYTPWFSVGDKVTYKKFPEQVFTVTDQGRFEGNGHGFELYWYNLKSVDDPDFICKGAGQSLLTKVG